MCTVAQCTRVFIQSLLRLFPFVNDYVCIFIRQMAVLHQRVCYSGRLSKCRRIVVGSKFLCIRLTFLTVSENAVNTQHAEEQYFQRNLNFLRSFVLGLRDGHER